MKKSKLKFYYSVAVVSKFNIVKLFICSLNDFEEIQNLTEEIYARKVLTTTGDQAECKIKIEEQQIREKEWTLSGQITTRERCYSYGITCYVHYSFEVYVIKSLHSPYKKIPPIKLWCGTCVNRASSSTILYPSQEAQEVFERDDLESILKNKNYFRPRNPNNTNNLPQKIGKTKYDVKLVHISTGYKI